jgi:hypothetical protein
MSEKAIPVNFGFATADAEAVSFSLQERRCVLKFIDWREQPVVVQFEDTAAVKWQEADSHGPEDRDDNSYEIANSEWLADHVAQNIIDNDMRHKHLKLCFNAAGVFEIICRRVEVGA